MSELKNILKMNNVIRNSQKKDVHLINQKSPAKKQKNVPAQIWAKRNVLKKLTLQLKFNKNQTKQYKKIRTQIQDAFLDSVYIQKQKKPENIPNKNQTHFLKNQKNSQIFNNFGEQNSPNYNHKSFALNAFSANGLNYFHLKSVTFQGNNFINVSKAIISQKTKLQINTKPYSHRKLSYSHRQKNQQLNPNKRHQRSKSFSQNNQNLTQNQQNKKSEFLKVSTKKLHFNNLENSDCQNSKESTKIFMKRSKTQANNNFTVQLDKRKLTPNQIKLNFTRPKSCIVKAKKHTESIICQGWKIKKSARQQEQPFPDYCHF